MKLNIFYYKFWIYFFNSHEIIKLDSQTERESSKKSKRGSSKSNATDKVDKNLRKRTQKEKSKSIS